jgi:hypothetical protein
MKRSNGYIHLEPRPGSRYRQWFVKGRNMRAEVVYRAAAGVEPRTPEEVARDLAIPIDAVHEAIDYCRKNESLLNEERSEEAADIHSRGLNKPPHVPPDSAAE